MPVYPGRTFLKRMVRSMLRWAQALSQGDIAVRTELGRVELDTWGIFLFVKVGLALCRMGSLKKAHDFSLCVPVEASVPEQWCQVREGGQGA